MTSNESRKPINCSARSSAAETTPRSAPPSTIKPTLNVSLRLPGLLPSFALFLMSSITGCFVMSGMWLDAIMYLIMTAKNILDKYIVFFEKRGHKRIPNASLIPENDPTTLFTSSGMQPLVPYLLGEQHPQGKRLVNVQNSFRAPDIDEIGDNRHTTFFRMLGNWSLGDYFKREQLSWFFEFLTSKDEGLGLNPKKLFVTAF